MRCEHIVTCYDPVEETQVSYVTEDKNFWTREVAESFSELLNVLPGMVYRCENNRRWTMLCISNDCIPLTGYAPQEFLKNARFSFNDLIHPDDREQVWEQVQQALREQRNFQIQYRIQHRDGHIRWVWEQGCGAFDLDGRLTYLQGVVLEDSLRGMLEEKISAAHQGPEFKTYVNSIAHDLGNLFSVIKNYANTIKRRQTETETASLAQKIVNTTTRATELLSQLLDLQEQGHEEETSCLPAHVLQNLQPVIAGLFDQQVDLRFDTSLTGWQILVNVSQLERAIVNLAINSARAMPAGGMVKISCTEVTLSQPSKCVNSMIPAGDYVCFQIRDSGVGMQADEILKAFEPYHSTRADGRGLGLPMVLAFSRKYLGGIKVESRPGEGTLFAMYIPRGEG